MAHHVERVLPAVRLLKGLQDLVDGEARGLLAWRVLLKRGEERSDLVLRGHQQEHMADVPVPIGVRCDGGALVRVRLQVEQIRKSKVLELPLPDPSELADSDLWTPAAA